MKKNSKDHRIDSFLSSLSYWELINLRITLIKAQNQTISSKEAYDQATFEFTDNEQLKFEFERALESGC